MTPTDQLIEEVSLAVSDFLAWLGLDIIELVGERVRALAPDMVAKVGAADEHERAEAVRTMLFAVHGHCAPPHEWWTTPLGCLCAAAIDADPNPVTWATAAAMLGVRPGTVAQMMYRGNTALVRHRYGGIVRGSVFPPLRRDRPRIGVPRDRAAHEIDVYRQPECPPGRRKPGQPTYQRKEK